MRKTRRASRLAVWACATAIGFGAAKAWAQAPSPEADATEQRRLRQRIEEQREKLEPRPDVHLDIPASHAGPRWPEEETPCFFIERLRWDGLPAHGWAWLPGQFSQGTDTPIGRCLGALGVAAVVQQAQNAVVARGYVTTRVLVEPQDLAGGELVLRLLVGRVGHIRLQGDADPHARLQNALATAPGEPLNLRDLEQSLENLQRLPTVEADIELTPANQPLHSDVVVRWRQRFPWPNTTSCAYRATELPDLPEGRRSNFFVVPDIFETQGKTMQASNVGLKPMDFDPWVRSVKEVSREKGKEGQIREVGLRPVCFDYWWKTSNFLDLSLRKSTLQAFELHLSKHYQKARWSTRQVNGHAWRVAEVLNNDLDPKPLNGIGGPYQAWLTALGDSGYVMSIEMGASRESLAHPQAHAEVEAVLHHLVRSLKVEQIAP